jgi:hypothetical protein
MRIVRRAQPIRTYEPPISIVWTRGEPCTDRDCAVLTTALRSGDADIIEHGRWGPYNAILRWSHPEEKRLYFVADVREAAQPTRHDGGSQRNRFGQAETSAPGRSTQALFRHLASLLVRASVRRTKRRRLGVL